MLGSAKYIPGTSCLVHACVEAGIGVNRVRATVRYGWLQPSSFRDDYVRMYAWLKQRQPIPQHYFG